MTYPLESPFAAPCLVPAGRTPSLSPGLFDSQPRRRPAGSRRLTAWRELANKLSAYGRVRLASLGPGPRPEERWEDLVAAVYRRAPWAALFHLERLGYDLTVAAFQRSREQPRGLLHGTDAAGVPEESLILLHCGMGLALADLLIGGLSHRAGEAELTAALERFVELCRANCRPGWLEPSLEPLGILVRVFEPRFTQAAGRILAEIDPLAASCYWHGVGRGIYFLPRHFTPGSARRAVAACRRESPEGEHRLDALSGLFFATAMVNLRHPRVLEEVVAAAGEDAREEAAITGGISSCVLARFKTTPHDPAIPSLLDHGPGPGRAALWERRVREPVEQALASYFPLLEEHGLLPTLARHRDLAVLAAALPVRAGAPDWRMCARNTESTDPGTIMSWVF